MRVIMACAGTGGHINPAISIANTICARDKGSQILFIGTQSGLENELVKKAGYEIKHIRTGKLLRSITLENIKAIYNSILGIKDSKKILKEFKPDVVIGTGGYICIPVMMASKKLKLPYILHESNAFPGLAVKLTAKKASCVMIGFKEAKARLKNRENVVYTGTPIKFTQKDIENMDMSKCKKELKLSDEDIGKNKKIIMVIGGSQGAKKINETVIDMVATYKDEKSYFVLAVGHKNYEGVLKIVAKKEKEQNIDLAKYLKIEKYIYDMESMYKVATLCIARSGAMTINELIVAGIPSILIPLPSAAENHQLYNAKVLENINAASVIIESDLTKEKLYETVNKIIYDDETLKRMSTSAKEAVTNDVDDKIYSCIEKICDR